MGKGKLVFTFSYLSPEVLGKQYPIIQNITRNDFDGRLKINKSDKIYIPLHSISDTVVNHLKRIAAFKNPEFYSKQAMRISKSSSSSTLNIFAAISVIIYKFQFSIQTFMTAKIESARPGYNFIF